jgi:hypothetical protein
VLFHERFWSLVRVGEPDECWPWRGYSDGYHVFRNGAGRQEAVHRIAYRLSRGPIPKRHVVHHTCETHPCCNPRHLEALTRTAHQALHAATRRGVKKAATVPRSAKWRLDPVLGCHLWEGGTTGNGYPVIYRDGKTRLARRWFYEEAKGPVPPDTDLRPTCKRKLCVNPAHVSPTPHAVAVRLPRARRARPVALSSAATGR